MFAEAFLKQLEQGIFQQSRGFERVVELFSGVGHGGGLEQGDQVLGAPRFSLESLRKAGQLLIGPRGGDAKAGMDQDQPGASQGGEKIKGGDDFAAASGQSGTVLQKKWNIGSKGGGKLKQRLRRKRLAEKFVHGEEGVAALPLPPPKPAAMGIFFSR